MSVSTNHLQSRLAARTYAHDVADATVATQIAWVPMTFQHFMALLTFISGTGVLTFKIFAATDESGTNPTEVKAHATPTVADAAGDQLVLEVSAEEVLNALPAASHVSVQVDCDHADDIAAVTYIRAGGRFSYDGQTADVVA
jgi:putative heme iron utilization protein